MSWQLPTRIETVDRVDGARPPRRGAEPDHPHLPRARSRATCCSDSGAAMVLVPGEWRGFDYGAMAKAIVAELDHPVQIVEAYHSLPEGDPSTLPPPPAPPARRRGGADPLALLHVGHHREPEGRAPHRRDAHRRRGRSRRRARHEPRRRRLDGVPVRAHRRPRLSRHDAHPRLPRGRARGVRARRRDPGVLAARRDDGGRQHRVLHRVPRRAAQAARRRRSSRRCGCCRAAARRSRPRCSTRCGARWASPSRTATA